MVMQKLVYCEDVKLPDAGGLNDPPPNLRKMTEKEFAQSWFFSYGFAFVEYRQVMEWKDKKQEKSFALKDSTGRATSTEMRLYWRDEWEGIAILRDYWKGKVFFYSFARCIHEFEGLSPQRCRELGIYHAGRCYSVSKCRKCGHVLAVDSSD